MKWSKINNRIAAGGLKNTSRTVDTKKESCNHQKEIRDFLMYAVVGGLATIVEWGVFYVLDRLVGVSYILATAVAFVFSTLANWFFGRLLVFKRSYESLWKELTKIYLTSIVGLAINIVIMIVCVELLSINSMFAKIMATGVAFVWNYLSRKHLIYRGAKSGDGLGGRIERLLARMNLDSKSKRIWFFVLLVLLVAYVEVIIIGSYDVMGGGSKLLLALLVMLAPICVCGLVYVIGAKIPDMKLRARKDRTRYWRIFCLIWLVTFAVLLLWQLAFWPGSFDPDTATQYAQAIGRDQFTDWHPAINTFLFYWLPYKMTGDFAAIVLFQNILFSLATAYLIATLYRRGIPVVAAVVAYLMIVLNPNIGAAMINPWKDCAMMAFAIAFVSQAFSIYRTKGKWLKKKKNVIALTIVALFICLVRHNSILFMFPAYVTLIVYAWDRRKVLAFSFTTMIVLMLVIRGPIYSMANVVPAWNRQVETLGIPMTILSDIYVQDRDCMSPEARGFMSTIASEEVWRTRYSLGNFDSIKWPEIGLLRGDNNPIEREGAAKILKYTYEVARAHPGLVLKSLFTITSQVWAIDGSDGNRIELRFEIADESLGVTAHDQNESLKKFLNTINASYSKYAIKYLFNYIGVVLLVLFTVAVARIGKIGIGRALAVVPIMCYCLASMLLVTGPAFRIFLFVFPIFMPTLYVLMFKDKKLSAKKDLQRRAMVK